MSFITRCPSCQTAFKVVQDQLKISDGWVRCGQCQHIFDATLDLEPWWPGLDQVPVSATPPAASPPQTAPAAPEPAPEPASAPEPDPPAQPVNLPPAGGMQAASAAPVEPAPAAPTLEPEEQASATVRAVLAAPDEPQPLPTFVRLAQRRAWWQRPLVRLGLGVSCLLLALALAVQVAQRWHVSVARQLPAAQPVLETLCQSIECAAPELEFANAVVIDSTVLLRRAPGHYSFQVVLRNPSSLEVPSPAIELTLTDIHDQVLVRRVLLPQEWPRPRATLAAGSQWTLQFELALEGVPERVMTGYRAILFYP